MLCAASNERIQRMAQGLSNKRMARSTADAPNARCTDCEGVVIGDTNLDNQAFFDKSERCFRQLFEAARDRDELQFAFSLNPEFRGLQGPGWSTSAEVETAFDEYVEFIGEGDLTRLKARVALGFYCHLAGCVLKFL